MLRKYLALVVAEEGNGVESLMLMAKQHLIRFYISCGFTCKGLSAIVHGQDPWFDLAADAVALRRVPFTVVDAFTDVPGTGNPAAVVILREESPLTADRDWMQLVAKEFNLSETVFVIPRGAGFTLYYFTPTTEIPLCGHATLAAAAVLYETGRAVRDGAIKFVTRSGLVLRAHPAGEGRVELDFPENEPRAVSGDRLRGMKEVLRRGLGLEEKDLLFVGASEEDIFVELTREGFLGLGEVDKKALCDSDVYERGVVVSTKGAAGREAPADFSSRFFAPKVGIDEDPACGSAHCVIAPYYHAKRTSGGAKPLVGWQNSPRGGELTCVVNGDGRVRLTGGAVAVSEGFLRV